MKYSLDILKVNKYKSLLFFILIFLNSCNKNSPEMPNKARKPPRGMIWIAPKTFLQGAKEDDKFAMPREKPAHEVTVDFFLLTKQK